MKYKIARLENGGAQTAACQQCGKSLGGILVFCKEQDRCAGQRASVPGDLGKKRIGGASLQTVHHEGKRLFRVELLL